MLLLATVVQPSAQLSCVTRYSRRTNKFSKVKIPWPTYRHCLRTTWF